MASRHLDEESIFHTARKIAHPAAQAEYLEQICAGDQSLYERVKSLLEVEQQETNFLKSHNVSQFTSNESLVAEQPGQQIGRYKLLQKIGEGGFGVVYMADQQRPVRRKVALKIIKPGMDTQSVIARFEAERQALAMMDDPNIARVLDGGETESGRPYFVMELVKGLPITEYCDKNELSTTERLALFKVVCDAVQH
ncbi:MAG: protein kinase, partial [Planctomycetales bacterium]|nr:protein kinase [Planctomycetales bacterium]